MRHDMNTLAGLDIYNAPDRSDSQGPRLTSNVELVDNVANPYVRIHTRYSVFADGSAKWASGGFHLHGSEFTYGTVTTRLRLSSSYGTRGVILFWPTQGWPPELDFFEIGSENPSRNSYRVSNHWADSSGTHHVDRSPALNYDFTRWRTYKVTWHRDYYELRIGNTLVWQTSSHVPSQPMWVGAQTAQGPLSAGQTRTPTTFDIDYIEINPLV